MRIAIVTDAWSPQVNGVVTTLSRTRDLLEGMGHSVQVVSPEGLRSVPLPTYPEIRLALGAGRQVERTLEELDPDAIHIATEGPLGLAARRHCLRRGRGFTTSYHTRFPEYLRLRAPVPLALSYGYVRWFHRPATRTLVATPSMREQLARRGFAHLVTWSRGVDTTLFRPRERSFLGDPRPIFMYVGRVAVEKNVSAFLNLDLPGTRYVIGDGPALAELRERHPQVRFPGYRRGVELASYLAAADVMVFPSLTDTFGLVLLEAMACGVPVAAFPVPGPVDLVREGANGCLDADLRRAALRALEVDPAGCVQFAGTYSWESCTRQFLAHLDARLPARSA
jgi:glycosyltransferase involved in cell wall biosynthesis